MIEWANTFGEDTVLVRFSSQVQDSEKVKNDLLEADVGKKQFKSFIETRIESNTAFKAKKKKKKKKNVHLWFGHDYKESKDKWARDSDTFLQRHIC